MTRRSQTETAVLGALSVMPMTGYGVRESIREVLGHFWSESFGQIYPTLNLLEEHGHVSREGSAKSGASTYRITAKGEERLRVLLAEPIQSVRPRNGLLLRLFFGRHLGPVACADLVRATKADAEAQLAEYQAIRAEVETEEGNEGDRNYWLLTVSAGEHAARATIAWADESLIWLEGGSQ